MNSDWPIGPFPKPPPSYDASYFSSLVRAVEETLRRAKAPGPIRVSVVNPAPPYTATADFSVSSDYSVYINNKAGSSCTATLPPASTNLGVSLTLINYQAQTLVSASSNVVPQIGGAAGTAILAATAGKWADLYSDGSNWIIVRSG